MLRAISLYTGVGGLDLGFEAAGFRTVAAVEIDPVCCRTLRLNHKWPVLEGDIHEITSRTILRAAGLRIGEADVLIGGPPCQPFSKSGYWARGNAARLDDPRSDTLTQFLRVLRDTRPRAYLLENVEGLVYSGKDEGLRHLLAGIEAVNSQARTRYSAHWTKLNAADFGVPQMRERIFLVGGRKGQRFEFPAATHGSVEGLFEGGLEPYLTSWDAIGDLPTSLDDPSLVVGGKWGDLLDTIPEGQNYLWHTPRRGGYPLFGWRRRYWSFLLKLAKDRPAWTIQAQPGTATGPFHWASRRLSAREMARLQTIPDHVTFDCGRHDVQKMLGNAVPSLFAEVLASEIKSQLLGARRSRGLKLLPERGGPPPPPEKTKPLRTKYRALIGDQPDHPGEGRGPRGLSREGGERNLSLI